MARTLYVVVDTDREHIVRDGFFGQQLYTRKESAKKVARENEDYVAYKLTTHGMG